MKKLFAIALCLILGAALLTGCSDGSDFRQERYTASAAEVQAINIDVRDRKIEISVSQNDEIQIDYYESAKESYDFSVSDDHVLSVTAVTDKNWTDYFGGKAPAEQRVLSVQVHDSLLSSLTVSSTNEDITLSPLTVTGDVSISANGGDIVLEQLDVGSALTLTAKNGDIRGTVTGGYDDFAMTSEVKKGTCNLPAHKEGGSKTLNVSNNNGDIQIEFTGS